MEVSDLTNSKPAVRTIPPTAHETLALNGMALNRSWKSFSMLIFLPFLGTLELEGFHESEIISRLALPP